jgi:hypothetical protein
MRQVRIVAASLLVAAVAGCAGAPSGGGDGAGGTGSAQPVSAAPATTVAPTTAPSTTAGQPAWPTDPRHAAGAGARTGELVSIRTGRHDAFDRVVFQFNGSGTPGYDVKYVDHVTQDPSDRPVPLQGRAFLWVVVQGASTADMSYRTVYTGPDAVTTGYPSLKQIKLAGDFERVLSFGLGVDHRSGYRVLALSGPPRLVVDVAR